MRAQIWIRLVMMLAPQENFLRRRFEAVVRNGVRNFDLSLVLLRLTIPVVLVLCTFLALPYVVIVGLLPVAGRSPAARKAVANPNCDFGAGVSLMWRTFFYRFCYHIMLGTIATVRGILALRKWLIEVRARPSSTVECLQVHWQLHDSLRDEKYLIGTRLTDFQDTAPAAL